MRLWRSTWTCSQMIHLISVQHSLWIRTLTRDNSCSLPLDLQITPLRHTRVNSQFRPIMHLRILRPLRIQQRLLPTTLAILDFIQLSLLTFHHLGQRIPTPTVPSNPVRTYTNTASSLMSKSRKSTHLWRHTMIRIKLSVQVEKTKSLLAHTQLVNIKLHQGISRLLLQRQLSITMVTTSHNLLQRSLNRS